MRILALLEATSITGTAKAVLEFAREAKLAQPRTAPIEVIVILFARGDDPVDNVLTRLLTAESIPFHFLREKGRFDFAVVPHLRRLVEQQRPALVWTHSVKSHFLVRMAGIQRQCRWVAFHHGYTHTDFKMRLYNLLDRLSLRSADRALTVCRPFADQMVRRGVPPSRVRVQHMPIRPFEIDRDQVCRLRGELKIDPEAKVILSIGRLSREKGHADLVRAFPALQQRNQARKLTLVMVGDGPERPHLQQLAGDDVIFTGHRNDIASFYGMADLFVLPSYTEGTPNVLLEAMSAHVPVIATRVGGIPELASHGENALLVESANVSALAEAMDQLLTSNELRHKLTSAAEKVVAGHLPGIYFQSLLAVFEEAVKP